MGVDVSAGIVDLRIEGCDHVSGFKPLDGVGDTKTRDDVAVFAEVGLRFLVPAKVLEPGSSLPGSLRITRR